MFKTIIKRALLPLAAMAAVAVPTIVGVSPALADGTCVVRYYGQFVGACGGTGYLSGTGFIQGDNSSYAYYLANLSTGKTYGPWQIGRDGARHYFVNAPAGLYEVDVVGTDSQGYPNYVHVHF